MDIKPTSPNGPNRGADPAAAEAARAQRTDADRRAPAAPDAPAPGATTDSAQVSGAARSLAREVGARSEVNLDPARLREIGERIANSYYDQPEVIDQVAQRIARDPGFVAG
jgi:hypothetical protein